MNNMKVSPEDVGTKVKVIGTLSEIGVIEPIIKKGVFECKSCMRVHEVEQKSKVLHEPLVCSECGGKTFKLMQDECTYTEQQILQLTSMDGRGKTIQLRAYGHNCSEYYNIKESMIVEGILHVELDSPNYYYIHVTEIA